MSKRKNIFADNLLLALIICLPFGAIAQPVEMPPQELEGGPPPLPEGLPPLPPGAPPFGTVQAPKNIAIEIKDGVFIKSSKPAEAKTSGKITDTYAENLTISTKAIDTNGLYVSGAKTAITINKSHITISNHGSDDNSGIAAGALSSEKATLILNKAHIETFGAVSSASGAVKSGTLKVFDSYLYAHGGPLPADYVPRIGPGMMEAPAPLGIKGTARTTIATTGGQAYYYNTKIYADGWGALSTDAAGPKVYVEANDCDIKVFNSGYGAYADNGAEVSINGGTLESATFGAIIAGTGIVKLNNLNSKSAKNSIMIHNVMGGQDDFGTLKINEGNLISNEAAFLIKSANAQITLNKVNIEAKNGVILHAKLNDDPNATKITRGVKGIEVNLSENNLNGDFINEDEKRHLNLRLKKTLINGKISMAALDFDANSKWQASQDSKVLIVNLLSISQIDAKSGVTIDAHAPEKVIKSGKYNLISGGLLIVTN